MIEKEITYANLFKLIELEESISFEIDKEYFQSTKIEIRDDNDSWVNVSGLIKKQTSTIKITFDNGNELICATNHILQSDSLVFAKDLAIGDNIPHSKIKHKITHIEPISDKATVYDMAVDSENHLYQCSSGIIHHNTLLTAAIIKYANQLNMRVIVIVPSSSLLKQTYDYINMFDIPVGMFGAGKKEDAPNIIATWQTLQNNKPFVRDFECVIWDECVKPNSMISMGKHIDKRIDELQVGDLVKTINEDTNSFEIKPIIEIHKNMKRSENQPMFKLTMLDGTVMELTGNHEVLTVDGWKRADLLILYDNIINIDESYSLLTNIEVIQYEGDVYNLHIQDNHNYFVNGKCVKNCHQAKAYIAQQIMNEARDSFMRIGLTGTIPKDPLDKANITAGFGPVTYEVKAHELQDRNILASINIMILELIYPDEYKGVFVDWHDETVFLQSNDMFQSVMDALVSSMTGNVLILMKNIDPAMSLAEKLGCTYISSKLSIQKRQDKFNEFTYGAHHIAVGTYSLLSTGIDIVHINDLILAPTLGKSFTKTVQSIGRGLRRKGGQKEHVNVIDFTSNMKYDRKHIKTRIEYYKDAQYPYEKDKLEVGQFKDNSPKLI